MADLLKTEQAKPYFIKIKNFLNAQDQCNKVIYPPKADIFNAFTLTPFSAVKVVIIGQDPYHGPGQAHGLCFSVQAGIKPPPSLINIYKELQQDLNIPPAEHGNLQAWAKQGVLLLNASLTVEAHQAGSHAGIGWSQFTDKIIIELNQHPEPIVFMLWGSFAHKKCACIDANRHCVLTAPHPSPLSAYRGYFGCKHFSKANDFLAKNNRQPIEWQL